ncbi:MAG: mechanosensitive ion channel family protein [Symbiobacteriia bacterium]
MKGLTTTQLCAYLLNSANWGLWADRLFKVVLVLVLARLLLTFGVRLVDRIFARKAGALIGIDDRRGKTLAPLLRSVLRYAVNVVAALTVLEIFLPPATLQPLLASAGIVGVAIGFGAQNLVRDIIGGFFILYEDQFAVGDYIKTGGQAGLVEDIGLRIVRLRDFSGEQHIIPNGKIETVTNLSRGKMRATVEVGVAYEESLHRVLHVLQQVARDVAAEQSGVILEGPEVLGVVSFEPSDMVIQLVAQTKPMQQWAVERALRRRIVEVFEQEGIQIPYPRQVFLTGQGTAGGAVPPAGRPERAAGPGADSGEDGR